MGNHITLEQRIKGAVLGGFIGDAMALGVHWIYNPKEIFTSHGRIYNYINPENNQYHKAKQTGDLTHYGDQTLVLMRSFVDLKFELSQFIEKWRSMWTPEYPGYVDGATRSTLDSGSSGSNDLAGASRIAPLLASFAGRHQESEFIEAAKSQTAFTHGDPAVKEAAVFFAALTHRVVHGADVVEGLESLLGQRWNHLDPANAVADERNELEKDTVDALEERGLDCHMPNAFHATLFVILKHQDSFEEALIENTMAGGDSAARGMLVGMVLGALHGFDAIPERFVSGLNAGMEIQEWVEGMDFRNEPASETNKF